MKKPILLIAFITIFTLSFVSCSTDDESTEEISNNDSPQFENFYLHSLSFNGNVVQLTESSQGNDTNLVSSLCKNDIVNGFDIFTIVVAVPRHPNTSTYQTGIEIQDSPGLIIKYGDQITDNLFIEGTLSFVSHEQDKDGEGEVSLFSFSGLMPSQVITQDNFIFINAIFNYKYRIEGNETDEYVDNRSLSIIKNSGC